jgi:hypothetical protein
MRVGSKVFILLNSSYHSAYKFKKLEEMNYFLYQSKVVLPIKEHYQQVNLDEFQNHTNSLIKKLHRVNLQLEEKKKQITKDDDDFLNDISSDSSYDSDALEKELEDVFK